MDSSFAGAATFVGGAVTSANMQTLDTGIPNGVGLLGYADGSVTNILGGGSGVVMRSGVAGITRSTSAGYGVIGNAQTDEGGLGDGPGIGVAGFSGSGYGVYGNSDSSYGVFGHSESSHGSYGRTNHAAHAGVWGRNGSGGSYPIGVVGEAPNSSTGIGVQGVGDADGVLGVAYSAGNGVYGYSDDGNGVWGYSDSSNGVRGTSVSGVGGRFERNSTSGNLRLPGTSTRPSTCSRGDVAVTSSLVNGAYLHFCVSTNDWRGVTLNGN